MMPNLHTQFGDRATGLGNYVDPVTGLYAHDALLEQLYDASRKNPDVPSFLIVGDMTNMTGVNDTANRAQGNRMMAMVAAVHQNMLKKTDPAALAGFKVHGDGMAWIVQGADLTDDKIRDALERAEKIVRWRVKKAGLSNLAHPRLDTVTGTGLSASFCDIRKSPESLAAAKTVLNGEVEKLRAQAPGAADRKPVAYYLNDHSWEKIHEALRRHKVGQEAIVHTLPAGFTFVPSNESVLDRRAEMETLSNLAGRPATLTRFSLYNLGGFNSLLGNDNVDRTILRPFEDMLADTLGKNGITASDYALYKREGGTFDLIINNDDGTRAAAVKKQLYEVLNREMLHKSVGDFAAENDVETDSKIRPGMLLADLPHKRDKIDGGGFVMTTVGLESYASAPDIFTGLERLSRLQNSHGISYIEETENTSRAWTIHAGPDNFIDLPRAGAPGMGADPVFRGLMETSTREQIEGLFQKPAGMIYEAMTGIDPSPVLGRQKQIFAMLEEHKIPAKTILANMEPLEKFDAFAKETLSKPVPHVDVADRLSTRPQTHDEFLFFRLVRRWGFMPDDLVGIDNVILEGQAAVRGLLEIRNYQAGDSNPDKESIIALARKDAAAILDGAKKEGLPALETAQLVNHAFKIAKHADEEPDEDFVRAGYSVLPAVLADVATGLKQYGFPGMGRRIQGMGDSLDAGPRRMTETAAIKKIRAVIMPLMTPSSAPARVPPQIAPALAAM